MLLDLKTNNLFLMNLQLYIAWIFEITMVITSALAWMMPYVCFILFAMKRRPGTCRLCIVVLLLKFMAAFTMNQFEFGYLPVYRCGIDGQLYENKNLVEPIIILSGFFTYLALKSPSISPKVSGATGVAEDLFNSRHFMMISVGTFLVLSYCSKLYLRQGNEASTMTSFEAGMMFTIIIKVLMNIIGMWPTTYNIYIEPSLNEEILLTHLCAKWRIDNNLPKLEKLTKILDTLTQALNAKKEFDRQAEELASKEQEDVMVYKQLLMGDNWWKMQTLVAEVLNLDSRMCYMKIK